MNGYIQIELAGAPVGLKFAYPAIKWFMEATVKNRDAYFVETENGETMTDYGMAKLVHCAYKNNCLLKEVEPVITFEQFTEWVTAQIEAGGETLANVLTAYADSAISKKVVTYAEEKKSLTSKLSNESVLVN
jgi:hypothetical protein